MGRALAERAVAMTAPPVITLSNAKGRVPRPDVDLTRPETLQPPEHVRQSAKDALDRGETHYTARPGVPELRRAIATRSTAEGFPATVDSVVVTNGGAEALYIALQTALQPGDRILVGGPVAPNITRMIEFIGATAQHLPLRAQGRFMPDADDLSVGQATGARALLLASPSPVTGSALPGATLERLLRVALSNGLTVILDRTHATCYYDPALARFSDQDLGARVLTTGSFSTGHGLAGWRAGWFSAPAEHVATMRELKQAMSICTSAVAQYAALAALEGPQNWLGERRAMFAAPRRRHRGPDGRRTIHHRAGRVSRSADRHAPNRSRRPGCCRVPARGTRRPRHPRLNLRPGHDRLCTYHLGRL
jgi:aspartate aminotransferase